MDFVPSGFCIYLCFFCLLLTVFNSAPVRRNAKNIRNTGKKIFFNGSHIIPAIKGLTAAVPGPFGSRGQFWGFSTGRVIQAHDTYCARSLCCDCISSVSDRQAVGDHWLIALTGWQSDKGFGRGGLLGALAPSFPWPQWWVQRPLAWKRPQGSREAT